MLLRHNSIVILNVIVIANELSDIKMSKLS